MKRFEITISKSLSRKRLDLALVAADTGLSRRRIRLAIDAGGVYLNRKRVKIASREVRLGDEVVLEYDPGLKKDLEASFALNAKDFIHIGPDFVVLNKPAGLASQATRTQSKVHVEMQVAKYLVENGENRKPVLVHRLDKDTSGVMILALSAKKALFLSQQFADRVAEKKYHAICIGKPAKGEFSVADRLSRPNKNGFVSVLAHGGRTAQTSFKMLEPLLGGKGSLMECAPKTGRTHQLRVHLLHKGLPIVGDKRYGGGHHLSVGKLCPKLSTPHHMLHAYELKIVTDKDRPARAFQAPYPASFAKALEDCRF